MKPNIFRIATKELSQDGFFTWLLQWGAPENEKHNSKLFKCAQNFIKLLLSTHNVEINEITKVDAGRQWENIDIWAKINNEYLIIIEDKTFTREHSNQLETYKKTATEWCEKNNYKLICIYLKTGAESKSSLDKIKNKGFQIIDRKELITFFENNVVDNDIYNEFVENLNSLERSINSFETLPIKEWNTDCWRGFYEFLDTQLEVDDWHYVANPRGGFLGLWWHFLEWKDYNVYLQIEQGNLCFKIGEVYKNHSSVRNEWFSVLSKQKESENLVEIKKPPRFGKGTFMTVGIVRREDWLGQDDSILDKEQVIRNLKKYENFLSNCVKQSNTESNIV